MLTRMDYEHVALSPKSAKVLFLALTTYLLEKQFICHAERLENE